MSLYYKTLGDEDGNTALTIEIEHDSEGNFECFTVTGMDAAANRAIETYYGSKYLTDRSFSDEIDGLIDEHLREEAESIALESAITRKELGAPSMYGRYEPSNMTLNEPIDMLQVAKVACGVK